MLVCAAWPYANGPIHLGHLAGCLLPADIFARFHRLSGADVLMVSGSDQHGTPITVQAEERGMSPKEVADEFHRVNSRALQDVGISFDLYFHTSHPNHRSAVQDFFRTLMENGYIYEKEVLSPRCTKCERFLPDRYVEGGCPHCQSEGARGDQCDSCGNTLDPQELVEPRCKLCGSGPEFTMTPHFFFRLSAFQGQLEKYVEFSKHWRPSVMNFTRNWLASGLKDRAATRDLTWGVKVPVDGWEDKRLYVWLEAVMGYYTTSLEWARRSGDAGAWEPYWKNPSTKGYYFMGKDNIPFHTIIWPALLMGMGDLNLPYDVPANEYMMLDSAQFSKSRKHAIYVPAYMERLEVDTLRFHLTAMMPEGRDSDFTWEDLVQRNNSELVGTLGNFIHRTLTFTHKHFGAVPETKGDLKGPGEGEVLDGIIAHAGKCADAYRECRFRDALREIMSLATLGNRYFDHRAPWTQIKGDRDACGVTLAMSLAIVKALNVMMAPILPHAALRLWRMYGDTVPSGGEGAAGGDGGGATGAEAAGGGGDPDEWVAAGSLPGDPLAGDRFFGWADAVIPPAPGTPLKEPAPLFRKLDLDAVLAAAGGGGEGGTGGESPGKGDGGGGDEGDEDRNADDTQKRGDDAMTDETIPFDEFMKLDLRVARVQKVEAHPNADKLYVITVDLGTEERTLVAGLKPYYKPEEMEGKLIVVVANLAPAKLRGVESRGMLLAAEDDEGHVVFLSPERDIKPGSKIH